MKQHSASLAGACIVAATFGATVAAAAAPDTGQNELATVEVSATRLLSVPDIDVPAAISTVQANPDSDRTQTNMTELLAGLPGVTALDRQNYAQDTQLSIRGNGSRSTFGVRGLRLYADGIPASMPDGQGQLSNFNVMGADTVQVLRGPFSALYGNSSGGVVQMWSSPGTPEPSARVRATYGSFDTRSFGAQGLGTLGAVDYDLVGSRFQTDGYRDHSAARRDSANLRLGVDAGENRSLTLVANYVDIPEAQDTLGLTPALWWADPRQTASVATQYNTRKSVEQLQGGAIFEQTIGSGTLRVMGYDGNRQVTQFLAIMPTVQANPLHSGGVVDLDGDYRGGDARWSWAGKLAGRPLEFTVGSSYDWQNQQRRGYEDYTGPASNSCSGATVCGVQGRLRRDESDTVDSFDQFAQVWWQFAGQWSTLAGLRHSEVKFSSTDHYIATGNPDDSGGRNYHDTTAVGGVEFSALQTLRFYASTGDGFETPTFNELAYRCDGGAGLAFYLKPEQSRNYELGGKWRPADGVALDAALFQGDTRDELVVGKNSGGRSCYNNVDRTRRQGIELSGQLPLAHDLHLEGSYTFLSAQFRSAYQSCPGTPCTVPVAVPAGAQIPGVPRHQGRLRLAWTPGAWNAGLEFTASSPIVVTDNSASAIASYGTDRAPGYALWNLDAGHDWQLPHSDLRAFVRVDNLFDRDYVGSVIVNEGNGRFFESGPERSLTAGLQWHWK
ncbi:MAG TPA: TonB-dependent receptor [Steroidobacteraceae bacterium]|nr:TonB-dependent receptor [Steroidobacteraceae bacterium]